MRKYILISQDIDINILNNEIIKIGGRNKFMTVFIICPPDLEAMVPDIVDNFENNGYSRSRIYVSTVGVPPVDCNMFYLVQSDCDVMKEYMKSNEYDYFVAKCLSVQIPYDVFFQGIIDRCSYNRPTILIKNMKER